MPGRIPTFKRRSVPTLQPKRSPDAAEWRRFIGSATWKRCRASFVAKVGFCEFCLFFRNVLVPVEHVHHERGNDPQHALDHGYLWGACHSCHSRITLAEQRGQRIEYPTSRPVQPDRDPTYQ
ncbi:MAG: hypothetical protein ACLQGP_00440 [Isosphaeraceae bacterium]